MMEVPFCCYCNQPMAAFSDLEMIREDGKPCHLSCMNKARKEGRTSEGRKV